MVIPSYSPGNIGAGGTPRSIFIPKNSALATLLNAGGFGELAGAADPASGGNCSLDDPGPQVKIGLQALYSANESNGAAAALLAVINQI